MFAESVLEAIYGCYPYLKSFSAALGAVFSAMLLYRTLWHIIGLFFTRKFKPALKNHKYAIAIAARNEENVIGNLLDSIAANDYPSELVTVFVVADNCIDKTAETARKHGAVCYERFDDKHKPKGYAL